MSHSDSYDWKMLEAKAQSPQLISTEQALVAKVADWRELPMVALDTEFLRVDTFYPIPGLIQLADDQDCYLIDPLAIDDLSSLNLLLEDPNVLKVLHACTEDLELFSNSYGVKIQPLFDTQLAGAYVGWGTSMGLRRMLEQELEVVLDKEETTSNWLQRPLTASQERYAALDVAYLPTIAKRQQALLADLGRSEWLAQECAVLVNQTDDIDPKGHHYYQRFSQMYRRREPQIAALRDLSAWREQVCRRDNVSRNRVIRNQALLQLVDKMPTTRTQLTRLTEMHQRTLRIFGDEILAIIQQASQSAKDNPPLPIPQPLHVYWAPHMKALKAVARGLGEEWNVPPEVLLRKKELEAIIRSGTGQGQYQLPAEMTAWRREKVGPLLMKALEVLETKE